MAWYSVHLFAVVFQVAMWGARSGSTFLAIARVVGAGLAGCWAIGLLILVGQAAGEVSGPCTVIALVIAAVTALLTGKKTSS
jgi:hypothetical protein